MALLVKTALFAFLAWNLISVGSAMTCKKEGFLGLTTYMTCPQPNQPETHAFCCGDEENRFCCSSPFGIEIDKETFEEIKENLPRIIGILFGVVVVLVLVCVVCCCCCPFCLLAKRRNRGYVTRGAGAEVTVTMPQAAAQPLQPQGQPQPYMQPQGYPPQPYPAQPYPAQPYPPQPGYPGQVPYPVAGAPGPMPAPGYPDQPPPYQEKQPAFNPNYAA